MQLKYIGPDPEALGMAGSALPLPEGWTAEDGDEPDAEVAAAKVASGLYAEVKAPPTRPGRTTTERED